MATSHAPATAAASKSKEKGNAAFKAGDYVAAIGHYTAAALADPSDPTFYLNRAAAYLKLSKNEDAERDCTTVLNLSNNKNVKALFRRAQARVALQNLGEAQNDLQTALKLEPINEAVKAELARVRGLIVNRKGKTVTRSAPIEVSTPLPAPAPLSSSPTAPPKWRRVPITIVEGSGGPSQPSPSASDAQPTDDLLNPISSRILTPSTPPEVNSPAPAPVPAMQQPKPPSFREAKQVREAKSAGRVGGGIFRMSGNDTLFKTREVPAPAVGDPPKDPVPAPAPAPTPARAPPAAAPPHPRTLFEFTRAWDNTPASDTAARWALLNAIAAPSLPALFGSSLEPALLASFVPVLASAAAPAPAAAQERHEAVSRDAVRVFMCALTRVPRFRTVVQFLSKAERSAAHAMWEAVVPGIGNNSVEVEEAARMWGFTDASAST